MHLEVADVPQPTLLFTFLGRIKSRAGREFEQVLAVLVRPPAATEFVASSQRWLALANPAGAINTRDVWKNHFAPWAQGAEEAATTAAGQNFRPIATDVIHRRRAQLRKDRERLHGWLESRAREIIADRGQLTVPMELPGMGPSSQAQPNAAPWARLPGPLERLAGFASDNSPPVALRHEAQTVLTLSRNAATISMPAKPSANPKSPRWAC